MIKQTLLAGTLIGAVTAFVIFPVAQAAPLSLPVESNSALILAQSDNQGFWGRLFNRSDKNSSAKPLFLGREGGPPASASGQVTPYDYGQAARDRQQTPYTSRNSQKLQSAGQKSRIVAAQAMEKAVAMDAAFQAKVNAKYAARKQGERGDKGGQASGSSRNKTMVYDPAVAKNYDPNAPRIYNRR